MITHILKDGTILTDITGHVVRKEEAEPLYVLLDAINERKAHDPFCKHEQPG